MFIKTQTLEYRDNKDELECIASALYLLAEKRYTEVTALLIARQDRLAGTPRVVDYDPRRESAAAARLEALRP